MTDAPISPPPPPISKNDASHHAAPLTSSRLIRSAMIVMVGFFFTKLVSLGQVIIIANRFGAGAQYDTFVLANNVPEQLIKIIGVGALSVAFIPIFSGKLNRRDSEGAWLLASQLFNSLLVVTLAVSVIVFLLAPVLVTTIVAPGFEHQWQIDQTTYLMRILLVSTIIFTLSSLFTGILNGHNHFFLTVLAPIFFDLGLLFGVIFFTPSMGMYGLAWGTVFGAVLHFCIQVPGLFMFKARWSPSLGWKDPELHTVVRLMIPRIIASFVFAINFLAIGQVASRLSEGSASAFSWGLRIMDIPEALIGTALGFVIFPTLAALSELGNVDERRKVFSQAVRFIVVATLPAAAGMLVLGKPAVSILFDTQREIDMVYAVVQVMAFAMILQSLHEVVARAFYAQKDTVRPLIMSTWGMVANLLVLFIGYAVYNNINGIPLAGPLGVGITAVGYTTAFLVELGLLTRVLQRRWGDIDGDRIWNTFKRAFAATLLMAIPVLLIDYGLGQTIFSEGGKVAAIIRVGLGGIIGTGLFLLGALLFNVEEVKQLPSLFRRRKNKEAIISAAS